MAKQFLKAIKLYLFIALVSGCSESAPPNVNYERNHIEFHQEHIGFIQEQKELIVGQFDRILNNLSEDKEYDVVFYDWKLLLARIDELRLKNEAYISDCILTDLTRQHVGFMKKSNGKLSTLVLSDRTDIEVYIREHQYKAAGDWIQELENALTKEIDQIISGAINYRAQMETL